MICSGGQRGGLWEIQEQQIRGQSRQDLPLLQTKPTLCNRLRTPLGVMAGVYLGGWRARFNPECGERQEYWEDVVPQDVAKVPRIVWMKEDKGGIGGGEDALRQGGGRR